ncbi:MAG: AAA family ATPase, partial [Roseiarcus sp.]|uniref:AAA family ATPase n=1 Tax=Roseiarcus sp. TaxID=1969460 RepID=UPI003C20FD85
QELQALAPELSEIAETWADEPKTHCRSLAGALDALAYELDKPPLVSVADTVLALSVTDESRFAAEHRRVVAALAATAKAVAPGLSEDIRAKLDEVVLGWALVVAGIDPPINTSAAQAASFLASTRTQWIARVGAKRWRHEHEVVLIEGELPIEAPASNEAQRPAAVAAQAAVRVCDLAETVFMNAKLGELVAGHEHVIGCDVPLAATPDIAAIHKTLLFEFPYAAETIDRLLADLVGRPFVHLTPTILVGPPGCGKSRLSRRLAEQLGAGSWRTDASTSDGAVFGGSARRWYSAEPCHAFLAISRSHYANPVVLIDEIEKAATRSDNGRFWDSLLGLMERETASRYPDPALQVPIDVSHVSYLATANSADALPAPLIDRMRILEFPEPRTEDLDSLLPTIIDELARARGLDVRWIAPLTIVERETVGAHWRGGSVRRLARLVEVVVRDREQRTQKQ